MIKEKIKTKLKRNKLLYFIYYGIYHKIKTYPVKKRKRKMIQEYGFSLLEDIHRILNKERVVFFIDFGTLLGIVRDEGFIKHDLDIDIGIIKQYDKMINNVKNLLIKSGYVLRYEYIYKGKIVEQSFLYKQIKFDICYYEQDVLASKCYLFYRDYEEEDNYPNNSMSVVQMTYDKIKGIEKHRIGKYEFNIPKDAEKLLEQKYGNDWRIPNSKWIYWKSPSASKCEGFGIQKIY